MLIVEGGFVMKIAEVSQKYNISADTLRYYERIGLIVNVPRNKSGVRDYSQENLDRIEFIKCMRSAGLSIDSLLIYFKLYGEGDSTIQKRRDLLLGERKKLEMRMQEIQTSLDILNYKIRLYEGKEA